MYKDGTFHAEHVNDRWKLMMHRIIARKLSQDPDAIIEDAFKWLSRMDKEGRWIEPYDHWVSLLREHPETVRREITRRTEHMNWLRSSSPFLIKGMNDIDFRLRSYKLASHGLKLRSERIKNSRQRISP